MAWCVGVLQDPDDCFGYFFLQLFGVEVVFGINVSQIYFLYMTSCLFPKRIIVHFRDGFPHV